MKKWRTLYFAIPIAHNLANDFAYVKMLFAGMCVDWDEKFGASSTLNDLRGLREKYELTDNQKLIVCHANLSDEEVKKIRADRCVLCIFGPLQFSTSYEDETT